MMVGRRRQATPLSTLAPEEDPYVAYRLWLAEGRPPSPGTGVDGPMDETPLSALDHAQVAGNEGTGVQARGFRGLLERFRRTDSSGR
jgi:hypothetical protein